MFTMVFCSNLYVKALLSQMLITVLEIPFEHMYGVSVCVLCVWFVVLVWVFLYVLDIVINGNYSC